MTEKNISDTNISHESDIEIVKIEEKQDSKFNHVWWLPLIALIMVVYFSVNRYASQGPLIHIKFETAEGLEVGKTKLRYKDVNIGKVEKINLDQNYKDVLISVRLNKENEGLLREKTQFWVVRPRISVTKVSGLGTLLSGSYIAIDPDKSENSEYRYEFEGLNSPPVVTQDKPGLRLTLLSSKARSMAPGTAVYFKGMQVGSVDRVYFSPDYLWVKADIFITSPHDKLIQQGTKFWSASGVSIDAGTNGVDIEMESFETLLAGGIVFDTPVNLEKSGNVTNGTEYILYDNKKQAREQNYGKRIYFVTYFKGNLNGLEIGSPVMLQGIKIGKIKDVQLLFDEITGQTKIPILFEVYENRLGVINSTHRSQVSNVTKRLVEQGLRARIETASLLTGSKYISLIKTKNIEKTTLGIDNITGYPIIPSVPESFDELTSGINSIVAKVNQMPLNEIATNIKNTLETTNKKLNQLDITESVKALNELLNEGTTLATGAKKSITHLDKIISRLSKSAEKALQGFSPNAPLYHNLSKTLLSLNEVLETLRVITDTLARKPNALIFGDQK